MYCAVLRQNTHHIHHGILSTRIADRLAMAILKIHVDLAGSTSEPRNHELFVGFVNPGDQLDDLYELSCPYLIHVGYSSVVMGELKVNGQLVCSEVACKMVEGDAVPVLEAEAKFYTTTLLKAQHIWVPRFILYATGVLPPDQRPYACMLTRYGGRAMTGGWTDNSIYHRQVFVAPWISPALTIGS